MGIPGKGVPGPFFIMLKFSPGKNNSKLAKLEARTGLKVYSLSLLSGHTCPAAKECHSRVENGKIVDGKHTQFRCFSASEEALFTNVFKQRSFNTELLRNCHNTIDKYTALITQSIPINADIIRIHVAGDFFTKNYLKSWIKVANLYPHKIFYAYTKSISFLLNIDLPKNLRITASYGGKFDNLIEQYKLKYAKVVYSPTEADKLNLELDEDDYSAAFGKKSFALLLHGVQPAGSEAGKFVKRGQNTSILSSV